MDSLAKKEQHWQAGFSLVELLVVVAILAIMLGVGLPALGSLRKAGGFTKDTQQLADILGFARSHAMSSGRIVDVGLRSSNDGTVLAVGEREGTAFHPIARETILGNARLRDFNPVSAIPTFQAKPNGPIYSQIVRFNARGEARLSTNGVDRKVTLMLLPNIDGKTPDALTNNLAKIEIHGLSGGVTLIRDVEEETGAP